MGKSFVGCPYKRSADGMIHTHALEGAKKASKNKKTPEQLARAEEKAVKRERDAEVCRQCTKEVCRGSAACIAKQRKIQEEERMRKDETAGLSRDGG